MAPAGGHSTFFYADAQKRSGRLQRAGLGVMFFRGCSRLLLRRAKMGAGAEHGWAGLGCRVQCCSAALDGAMEQGANLTELQLKCDSSAAG